MSRRIESNPDRAAETHEESDDAVIGRALVWSLGLFVLLASIAGGTAWWLTRPETKVETPPPPPTLPAARRSTVSLPEIRFTDITEEAGIRFKHENGAVGQKLLPETMGGGAAFFDYDNDGDQDLLLVNSQRWPWDTRPAAEPATMALYANDGTGRFTDVTAETGLNVSFYGMGVACGDYDNDGWVDVYITAVGPNRLFRNRQGRFLDVTDQAGVAGAPDDWGTSCGWFDYDNDGDLDLFVCNYVRWSREYDLAQDFRLTGGGRAYGRPQDFDGSHCLLFRNEGDGRFADVSEEAGIQVDYAATGAPLAKSLGVTFVDFDGDGRLDIVVANDTVRNFLFHNQGDGTFRERGIETGIAFDIDGNARGAMGIDACRFRNDPSLGVAIGNFSNEMTALYVARGSDMAFRDEAVSNGLGPVTRLELTFGLFFFDPDLDGRPDLLAANGHLEEDINQVQSNQHYEQPPQLLWNAGPEHPNEFVPLPVEKTGPDFAKPMVGRGAAYADIDGDGDQDVLITATGRRPRLLRNDCDLGHHWLRVKLEGSGSNRDAIGARVDVHLADRLLSQQVMPTRSYLSQVELPLTFGLGDEEHVEKLVVVWPDGSRQQVDVESVDRLIEVKQESADSDDPAAETE